MEALGIVMPLICIIFILVVIGYKQDEIIKLLNEIKKNNGTK